MQLNNQCISPADSEQYSLLCISLSELQENTDKILNILDKHNIKTIGFVNEQKLYLDNTEQRIAILNQWIKFGHDLGNHTYSHADFYKLSLSEFKAEIIKGESVIRNLMSEHDKKLSYFRFPYSHTGLNAEDRREFDKFLAQHEYKIAPLTIDTDDWIIDEKYVQALDNGRVKVIEEEYLKHTSAKFDFYDKVTKNLK